MHRSPFFAALLILLSFAFSGCALAQPTPTELMMVFTEPFLCGFTYDDGFGEPVTASLLRDETGDLLTVYGTHATTVFFHDGASLSIRTRGNEDIPPLTMPIPAAPGTGAVSSLSLFLWSPMTAVPFAAPTTDFSSQVQTAVIPQPSQRIASQPVSHTTVGVP